MQNYLKGKVIAYSDIVRAGAIQAENDKVYIFSLTDWDCPQTPNIGREIVFLAQHERAKSIKMKSQA